MSSFGVDTSARTRHGALLRCPDSCSSLYCNDWWAVNFFQESSNIESQISDPSIIKNNIANKDNIKVIYANKEETELHNNYFKYNK